MAATLFTFSTQASAATKSIASASAKQPTSNTLASSFINVSMPRISPKKSRVVKIDRRVKAAVATVAAPMEEVEEVKLPTWAMFEMGRHPVYWKTMNGLPPTAEGGEAEAFLQSCCQKLAPNEEFGIAFNGGFNQPIMCAGEPRAMLQKVRGKADPPFYTIQICIPKHAVNLIFSFTNGVDWDGPYRLQFQVHKAWQSLPIEFFNEGLAGELSKEGACEGAVFPDSNVVVTRCALIGNLTIEGNFTNRDSIAGLSLQSDLVPGCMDRSSHLYNPLANVDDGSFLIDSDMDD